MDFNKVVSDFDLKIKCFIFSWKGQYKNACRLETQLGKLFDVTVINSDDDNCPPHWVNIGNSCYFSKQFRTSLDLYDHQKYDIFFHVQADASYKDFNSILNSAKKSYLEYNWGVFAPNVDDTFYVDFRTDVFPLADKYKVVATTDNTCWMVHSDIIQDMKNNITLMDNNELGWGWDLLICGFSHLRSRKVIRDYSITVDHPKSTGYLKDQAEQEMANMYNICPDNIKEVVYYIKMSPLNLKKYYGVDQTFIYNTGSYYA